MNIDIHHITAFIDHSPLSPSILYHQQHHQHFFSCMTILTRITSPADLFKCDTSYYLLLHLKRTERDAGDTDKMLLN